MRCASSLETVKEKSAVAGSERLFAEGTILAAFRVTESTGPRTRHHREVRTCRRSPNQKPI